MTLEKKFPPRVWATITGNQGEWFCSSISLSPHWEAREYISVAEHESICATLKAEAVEKEWEHIQKYKPFFHCCPDWDFLPIDKGDAEFSACQCFPKRHSPSLEKVKNSQAEAEELLKRRELRAKGEK